jgi:tetratricopeptide (TPR) repeat protein
MAEEQVIKQLLQELIASRRTPEEVCVDQPDLLPELRRRWQRVRATIEQLETLFPSSDSTRASGPKSVELTTNRPQIPGYEVQDVLGFGGMGVVYQAQHLALNRPVALKMVLAGAYATAPDRQRLLREAQAVATLHHPNIVTVFDVGECDGKPFFTMELVEGRNLAQRLAGTPQSARDAATLVATLADAVYSAHQAGLIHRDLKPANVLVTLDGTPKITDFGLARHVEGEGALTFTGALVGTPSYMAPEQARGHADALGPGVDIYSLGALLYEMLTGRPPFRAESALETQRQVIEEEPVSPSRLSSKIPRDLETICLKCLNKEPHRRYATAAALAEDLSRFLRGEPIHARPIGWIERVGKWVRRHTAATISAAASAILAATGLAMLVWIFGSRAELRRAVNQDLAESVRYQRASDWQAARDALERARGRLGEASFPDLRGRVADVQHDLELVTKLGDIRLKRAMVAGTVLDFKGADRDYREAFVTSGLDFQQMAPDVVAERIANSPIRAPLVAALDDWSMCNSQPDPRRRILEVARLADPDPQWRDRVRDDSIWTDAAALTRLAESANLSQQSVSVLVMLSARLSVAGGDARSFGRRIQREFPGDFWANYRLASELDKRHDPEAITYYMAALAIRPDTLAIYLILSPLCAFHGRDSEAIEYGQRAVRLEPHAVIAHISLAGIYLRRDDHVAEVIAECQAALEIDPNYPLAHTILGGAYLKEGRFAEACSAFERCAELTPPDSANHASAVSHAAACKRLMNIEGLVPAVLAGIEQPNQVDRCELASICFVKRRYADALRLYREAIAANPESIENPAAEVRLSAACAAVRAASDTSAATEHVFDGQERANLISDALAWLEAELAVWSAISLETNEGGRIALMQQLNRWKNRTDLAPIRDPDLLRELLPEQQVKCRALWREVNRLLQEAIAVGQ